MTNDIDNTDNIDAATKIGFVSLGCSKNQIDTEIMLKILVNDGYEIVPEDIAADIIIVNTCAFIESAKQEAIDNILDISWLKKHRNLKGIILCGCLAERYRDEIFQELPEVDAVIGVFSIHDILNAVKHIESSMPEKFISLKPQDGFVLGGERVLTTPEYMTYIKISEGCDNFCSYCAIPLIRGRFKSRDMQSIIDEAKDLAAIGVRELCIVAQDTTRYGEDLYGECRLPELLMQLCEIDSIKWIRLLYCYPDKITDELIEVIKSNDKIVKYIDMPIQHISDNILSAMNRRGGSEAIYSAIKRLRENIPDIIIRTTVIVGFPGESKQDFAQLCEFLKEVKFERLGAFAYSQEEGTKAFDLENHLSEAQKEHRYKTVMQLQERINYAINQKKIGKTIKVLCEEYDKVSEAYFGRSYADAPEIDGKIYFTSKSKKRIKSGEFVDVTIKEIIDYDLCGECL